MNKTEKLKEQIKNLQEELEKEEIKSNLTLQEKIISERIEEEKYFYIDYKKDINDLTDFYHSWDNSRYNTFNYFKDKKEAEKFARFEALNLKLIRLRDKLNLINNDDKDFTYTIEPSEENEIYLGFYPFICKQNKLRFNTNESVEEFLKLIPRNEIIEYLNF